MNNIPEFEDLAIIPKVGRILSIDPGTKRIGVAVSDEDRIVCRPLSVIERTSWKKLLFQVKAILNEFDAKALVIGLPLESNGSENSMSQEARDWARKFGLSLGIPVFLQDERVTSYEAKGRLWDENAPKDVRSRVDGQAAAIILSDFMDRLAQQVS